MNSSTQSQAQTDLFKDAFGGRTEILGRKNVLRFVTAGESEFTLTHKGMAYHYTYRLVKHKRFESGSTGTEFYVVCVDVNGVNHLLGTISDHRTFYPQLDSLTYQTREVECFTQFWLDLNQLTARGMYDEWDVNHRNRCGCCGRLLTYMESKQTGLGPTCLKKLEDMKCVQES